MKLTSKRGKEMIRKRWGHRVNCVIKDNKAVCKLNGVAFVGLGRTNIEATEDVFARIIKNLK